MSEKPTHEWRPSLKQKVLNYLAEAGIADRIGQKRAIDLVEKTKIRSHLKPGGVYLDVGTGLGHIVERVVKEEEHKDVKFIALDPTWKALHKVRNRVKKEEGDPVLFIRATGNKLPVAEKSFDGVSLFFVLHHVPPEGEEKIFAEIDRVLKDDGYLFLVEDTPDNDEEKEKNARWDKRLNFEPEDEAHYYRTDAEWRKVFEERGYELVDSAYFEDVSPKKNEGVIRHHSYILKRKSKR